MEFDNTTPVSDEQRRLAESKKITLQPLHEDTKAEDIPDAEIAARHLSEPAIANSTTETEQNTTPLQPSDGLISELEADKQANKFVIAAIVAAASGTLLLGTFFFFS